MKSVTSVAESSFQNIGRDMAERLGLGPEVRELKLGPSFTNNKSTAFHTLKCWYSRIFFIFLATDKNHNQIPCLIPIR